MAEQSSVFTLLIIKDWVYLVLASVSGILSHAMKAAETKEKFSLTRAFIETLGAAFAGAMVILLASALGIPEDSPWIGILAGVAGWTGASSFMMALEKLVWKKLDMQMADEHKKDMNDE